MNTTANRFGSSFDNCPTLDGSEYIEADLGFGVAARAYIKHDPYAEPDADDPQDVEAFNADKLHYCMITLNVYVGGACIKRGAGVMYQIGIEEEGDNVGNYLTDYANELLAEADVHGIVTAFARKANAAARKLKGGAK